MKISNFVCFVFVKSILSLRELQRLIFNTYSDFWQILGFYVESGIAIYEGVRENYKC